MGNIIVASLFFIDSQCTLNAFTFCVHYFFDILSKFTALSVMLCFTCFFLTNVE